MWLKLLLGVFFITSLLAAFVVEPERSRELKSEGSHPQDGKRLRLLSWNIGNGDLESETRAHTEDLPAVAQVIIDNQPDAVALQELTGEDQLNVLLRHLKNQYRGYVNSRGSGDRVEAVLVKNHGDGSDHPKRGEATVLFNDVSSGDKFAAAATFRLHLDFPQVVLVSAHADAFNAARRRAFVTDVVDWTRARNTSELAFIAGDFNLEVSTRNKNNLFTDDAKHDSESYAYLLKYFRDLALKAGETSINDRRIDYVFGLPTTVSLSRAEVLRGAAVGRMDHWPLLIEVGF
jgi:endonuclease/exonuclease/phosphatase family metal-dependent hydrolase